MIRAAIIGISGYGRTHLRMAREQAAAGRLRLVAAVVINAAEEAEECRLLREAGCRIYASTAELWNAHHGAIDLCFIPTAIHLHAAMTRDALSAGAHVLVEKPITGQLDLADELIALSARTGRFIAVGFQDIYTPVNRAVKRRILQGEWGAVESVHITGAWPRPGSYYQRNNWAGKVRVGGERVLDSPVSNGLAHFLNLALYFCGPAAESLAAFRKLECDLWRARPIENFDTCSLRLEFPTGARLSMHVTHSCATEMVPQVTLRCRSGRIVWTHNRDVHISVPGRPVEIVPLEGLEPARSLVGQLVVARAAGEPVPIFEAAQAREHVRIFSAMQVAAPIRDIAPDSIDQAGDPNDPVPAIRHIEQTILAASSRQALFSECVPAIG